MSKTTSVVLIVLGALILSVAPIAATAPSIAEARTDVASHSEAAPRQAAVPTARLDGPDRFATSAAIAARSHPDGASTVFVARGDAFADALAAGTLTDGPILLVPPCGAPPPVITQAIDRLDPAEVVALGGSNAVCDDLLATLASGRDTRRIAGADRFQTALEIADEGFAHGAPTVYLANGADSPDAVAGGSLTDGPIMLLPPNGVALPDVTERIDALNPRRVVALGGSVAVTHEQLDDSAGDRDTGRLAGGNRFATAVAIAVEEFGAEPPTVYLARADVFADAVASGPLADGPVLLVPSCGTMPVEVTEYLSGVSSTEVVALGGVGAVCDQVLEDAAALLTPAPGGPGARTGAIYFSEINGLGRFDVRTTVRTRPLDTVSDNDHFVDAANREILVLREPSGQSPEIFIHDLDSGELLRTVTLTHTERIRVNSVIQPSPTGDLYTFHSFRPSSGDMPTGRDLTVADASGAIVAVYRDVHHSIWHPDGRLLISAIDTAAGEGVLAFVDGDELAGDQVEVHEVYRFPSTASDLPEQMAMAPGGETVAYSFNGDIFALDLVAGGPHRRVVEAASTLEEVGWSPDGSMLALRHGRRSATTGRLHIVEYREEGDPVLVVGDGPTMVRDSEGARIGTSGEAVFWLED